MFPLLSSLYKQFTIVKIVVFVREPDAAECVEIFAVDFNKVTLHIADVENHPCAGIIRSGDDDLDFEQYACLAVERDIVGGCHREPI